MQMKSPLKQTMFFILCMLLLSYAGLSQAAGLKNINTATTTELTEVKGIGTKTAAAIVAYRDKHGTIKKMTDLLAVKGIGKKKLVNIQALFDIKNTAKKHKATPKPAKP